MPDSSTAEPAQLADFDALLEAARQHREPQRLLFVFAQAELGELATEAQIEAFKHGQGGHLRPCLCVDKAPGEIASFAALVTESEGTGQHWDVVFVASLGGEGGGPPADDDTDHALRRMVATIKAGQVGSYALFDRTGSPLQLIE